MQQWNSFFQRYFQLFLILIFFILTYILYFTFELSKDRPKIQSSGNPVRTVQYSTIQEQDIPLKMSFPANIVVRNFVSISPRVGGRVEWVSEKMQSGKSFKKGEILFKIDQDDYRVTLKSAEAQLERAKADYALAQAEANIAQQEWALSYPDQPIPDLVAKKPELMQARAAIKEAESTLERAKLNLSYTSFELPFDGIIQESNIEPGTLVTAGQTYGQAYSRDATEVKIQLSQDETMDIDLEGFTAQIYVDDRVFAATIDRYQNILNESNRAREVLLKPEKSALPFISPGMFIRAKLVSKASYKVYILNEAFLADNNMIYRLSDDNRVSYIRADILATDDKDIYVKSLGGDVQLVTGPTRGLLDGMKVRIIRKDNETYAE
ncbi:MAG: efflux RND transporter periplasmic adaptor subunit [Pseudomonadota bacterium]